MKGIDKYLFSVSKIFRLFLAQANRNNGPKWIKILLFRCIDSSIELGPLVSSRLLLEMFLKFLLAKLVNKFKVMLIVSLPLFNLQAYDIIEFQNILRLIFCDAYQLFIVPPFLC